MKKLIAVVLLMLAVVVSWCWTHGHHDLTTRLTPAMFMLTLTLVALDTK